MEKINYQQLRPIIESGIAQVYQAQLDILDKHLYREGSKGKLKIRHNGREVHDRTGNLRRMLKSPQTTLHVTDDSLSVTNGIPIQLRFFDMKHLGNWRIYNRQVWGILYGKIMGQVKMELYRQVEDLVRQQLNPPTH